MSLLWLLYADDLVLLAPLAKNLQDLIRMVYEIEYALEG